MAVIEELAIEQIFMTSLKLTHGKIFANKAQK
jgi:hypothetical protein